MKKNSRNKNKFIIDNKENIKNSLEVISSINHSKEDLWEIKTNQDIITKVFNKNIFRIETVISHVNFLWLNEEIQSFDESEHKIECLSEPRFKQ